ncbi:MAG: WGR domain-containing protein [Prochloraceae cyanobacterium]|nr:WGR domain-containing protein [Prochloraceae cyanobacterium]
MKLIKRTTLEYRSGTSDKVYEVDLCCISQNQYIVNFCYGRRGGNLKEGTKTIDSVTLAEAEKIFEKLVNSKIKKGYEYVSHTSSETARPKEEETAAVSNKDPRQVAILNRLKNRDGANWPLERVIWRAGELKIREAAPLLIELIGTGEPLRDYCIAWALGWCGDDRAIPTLKVLSQKSSTPEFVRRIAWEALHKLSDELAKEQMRSEKIIELPLTLRELGRNGTAKAFKEELSKYLNTKDYKRFSVLDTIYQIDNEWVRPALINFIKKAPLGPNHFKPMRHIFKMAEYRHDEEVFGILAYRFETHKAQYNSDRNYIRLPDGRYIGRDWGYSETGKWERSQVDLIKQEQQRPDTQIAYSNKTREYLRRRIWRTLKELGREGDPDYIKMAVEVLLQYSDADAQPSRQTTQYYYNSGRYTNVTRYWDTYAAYITLNHILYEHSPRYELKTNNKAWRCREGYKPGDPQPQQREEAFPELWDKHPKALVKLLLKSECDLVHNFAVNAVKHRKQFLDRLENSIIIQLLSKPYQVTVELAFEIARYRYNPSQPDRELVLALANCTLETSRQQAYEWIEQQREYFFTSSDSIASLVTSLYADTRAFARKLLSTSIIDEATAKLLIGQIIAELLKIEATQTDMAQEIGETLLVSFTPQLRNLGLGVIEDLLVHPTPEVQIIGARILLNHEIPAAEMPPELIESLLASPHDRVRAIGLRMFGQLSDRTLMSDRIFIVAMAVNSSPDIRSAIRPIIGRLSATHPDFAMELAIDFVDLLTERERHEGVHKDLVLLLQEDIPGWMSGMDKQKTMELIRSKSVVAQELGGIVLQENSDRLLQEFQVKEIVQLADREIFAVREAARKMFSQKLDSIPRDSEEMRSAVKMLESKWDDSREFALRVFGEFKAEDWTPEVTIYICDSVREDVRRFGRDLVTRHFQQNYGGEYLLKFSEHPSGDMQIFATNYLEQYAANSPEKLQELAPYFVRVLSGVNKGSVAKQRIFKFLDIEAQKSEAAARVVGEILSRQSVTMAIADKANSIQIMLKIKKQYPQIDLPLQVKEVVEVRR